MNKNIDKLRDQEVPTALGYELDRGSLTPIHVKVDLSRSGDHGCDPMGENECGILMFRMVPSGDIVEHHEKERRLRRSK